MRLNEKEEWGRKYIINYRGFKEKLTFLYGAGHSSISFNSIHSINHKEKLKFSFFDWFHWFLEEKLMGLIKEDIITVLSYIGWPVLNNKSMKENLFGWNWFMLRTKAAYGRQWMKLIEQWNEIELWN